MGAPFEGEELMIRCIMPRGGGLNGDGPCNKVLELSQKDGSIYAFIIADEIFTGPALLLSSSLRRQL